MPHTRNRLHGDQREEERTAGYQVREQEHAEGTVAKTIEQQTAKLPSDVFLWGAVGCMGASWLLQLTGQKHAGLFVGQWVAPLLLFGIYNKIVKVAGSDRASA
jgi:hypothetical protein